MEVITLLQAKGRCLERFLQISIEGLTEIESGKFDGLSELERRRENLLRALQLFEEQITTAVTQLAPAERTQDLGLQVTRELALQEQRLARIQSVDDRISALIQEEQERIHLQIQSTKQAQEQHATHQKFKSQWVKDSGGEFDQKA